MPYNSKAPIPNVIMFGSGTSGRQLGLDKRGHEGRLWD